MGALITDTTVEVHLNGAILNSMLHGEHGLVHEHTIARAAAVQVRARTLVPVRTGKLRDSLVKQTIRDGATPMLALLVGSGLPYAYIVHEGSPPHVIRPVRKSVLRFPGRGGQIIYAKQVNHPGTKPRRYLTEALAAANL